MDNTEQENLENINPAEKYPWHLLLRTMILMNAFFGMNEYSFSLSVKPLV